MLFQITPVKNCPVTRSTRGRIRIENFLLGEFLRTLHTEKGLEWGVELVGTRSKDGLLVDISQALIPTDQLRNGGRVKFHERIIPPEVVAVLHSHHEGTANFSGIDDNNFNTRYPVSIVIANRIAGSTPRDLEISNWLGFSYKAEGRVLLPCGSMGVVPFDLEPLHEVKGWPKVKDPAYDLTPTDTTLGDCNKVEAVETKSPLYTMSGPKCGVTAPKKTPVVGIFGYGNGGISQNLPKPQQEAVVVRHYPKQKERPPEQINFNLTSTDLKPYQYCQLIHGRDWSEMSDPEKEVWVKEATDMQSRLDRVGMRLSDIKFMTYEAGLEKLLWYEKLYEKHNESFKRGSDVKKQVQN